MSNMGELVVKSNALIEAGFKLGEAEQRLILLAILKARRHGNNIEELRGKELIIYAHDYAEVFDVNKAIAYETLKQAVEGLFEAKWGYKFIGERGEERVARRRFVQAINYAKGKGWVSFKFADDTLPFLVELKKHFTTYDVKQVAKLSGSYSIRLYELLMRFTDKNTGTGWYKVSLEDLRFTLGLLPNEYKAMRNFKSRVLDYAMDQINKNTDLKVSYSQKKQGRKIVGFCFEMKHQNPKALLELTNQYENQLETLQPTQKTDKIPPPLQNEARRPLEEPLDDLATKPSDEPLKYDTTQIMAITARIEEYIKEVESKGKIISQSYRQNITAKAFVEGWGLEELAERQRQETVKKQQQVQERASQEVEKMRQQSNKQETRGQVATISELFEALSLDEQESLLDSIQSKIPPLMSKVFMDARQQGRVHYDLQYLKYFIEYFESGTC